MTTVTRKTKLKFLTEDYTGGNTNFRWPIGEWVKVEGPLRLCRNGLHVTTPEHWSAWAQPLVCIAETRGRGVIGDDKRAYREARLSGPLPTWSAKSQRLLACEFAERVAHRCGDDPRPQAAIDTARRFARGLATAEELRAAGAAAEAASWAARAASSGVVWAATMGAATSAAREAAWGAAWVAARVAARAVEQQWQADRFIATLNGEANQE